MWGEIMINEKELKIVIEQVIKEMGLNSKEAEAKSELPSMEVECEISDDELFDITEIDLKKQVLVPNPENMEGLLRLKANTTARVGVWRAGPRYKTETLLRFRADHAVAMDAVFTDVSQEFLDEMNFFSVKTMCSDKDQYLTRPDLGRRFDDETLATIKEKCTDRPQVQIYVSDGLSSTSIEANVRDCLPAIIQGLEMHGLSVGTPFFVKYGRVPSMEPIAETLKSEVTCVLIGERPGLATGESMSCYMAYNAQVGMPESKRTVVSNIHKGGTSAAEAGAHIAGIIKQMIDQKASGLDLKV